MAGSSGPKPGSTKARVLAALEPSRTTMLRFVGRGWRIDLDTGRLITGPRWASYKGTQFILASGIYDARAVQAIVVTQLGGYRDHAVEAGVSRAMSSLIDDSNFLHIPDPPVVDAWLLDGSEPVAAGAAWLDHDTMVMRVRGPVRQHRFFRLA